jgi:hypothetical protein
MRTRLVLALLVGPLAAGADMAVLYILVYRAQATGAKTMLHATSALALGLTLVATAYAYRGLRREDTREHRFVATLGTVLGLFFALVIAAFEVPTTLLSATD